MQLLSSPSTANPSHSLVTLDIRPILQTNSHPLPCHSRPDQSNRHPLSTGPFSYEFFTLLPLLLSTKFPSTPLPRVQSFLHTYLLLSNIKDPALKATLLPPSIVTDPLRPHEDIHAFMDGLPFPSPFLARPAALAQLPLVALLEKDIDAVCTEIDARVGARK